MDCAAAEAWIREQVGPASAIEVEHERPWATVLRVLLSDRVVWFKACGPVQGFEPRLTAELSARWPERVAEVIAHDDERAGCEAWGGGADLAHTFALALRVGGLGHTCAWTRQRDHLPESALADFDTGFAVVLRRGIRTFSP